MTRWRADAALLTTALLWGSAFVAQKAAEGVVPPLTFVAVRFAISALALAPLAWFESRRAVEPIDAPTLRFGVIIALTLFAGSVLQQIGLATTTASNGGFLTACYVVLTPIAVWLLTGQTPRPVVAFACALSIAGAWLLAHGGGPMQPFSLGDGLFLISDFPWAFGIAMTPMFLMRAHRPFTLAFLQYGVCAVLAGVVAPMFETASLNDLLAGWIPLAYAGLVSGGVAFTLQIVAQRYAPASEAALLLSMESVFAALAGAVLLGERLTYVAMLGCTLILGGVLVVEFAPALLIRWRRAEA